MQEQIEKNYSSASSTDFVSISIVSHGQFDLVKNLLDDLARFNTLPLEVILTLNVDEPIAFTLESHWLPITVIKNAVPKGFGANHNAAFRHAKGAFFCVLNPDVRLRSDPFSILITTLRDTGGGAIAPLIIAPNGTTEDSARHFPTPLSILSKLIGIASKTEYPLSVTPYSPDWIAGMFMLFPSETFRMIGGFDERYFLYYEDVDICARLRKYGIGVISDPRVSCVHDARRTSHRNVRYMSWHLTSMCRYFVRRYLLNVY